MSARGAPMLMFHISGIKKVIHYDTIQRILKYYKCPDNCNAHCCRNGSIHLFEEEKNNLVRAYPERETMIRPEKNVVQLYLINSPCMFLNCIGRCEIYNERPVVCGLYPFKVDRSTVSIGLQPCPVGFDIIRDFTCWIVEHISCSDHVSGDDKQQLIKEWETELEFYAGELALFFKKSIIKELIIPFTDLEMFAIYVDDKFISAESVKSAKIADNIPVISPDELDPDTSLMPCS
ncbi:protein of unknown function UPF0153 [Methanosalsum zhilinae DSM 4017]|uniref:YkgJ family cysteine cluster protein n=1 Tax=Methanosalsum zhilinae (strain DSM 4017 / NBRC 107636 / OCM 62 / WeN5) TaxID=679901 RepID=F7XNN1_METZD|nr:YkgJ family cysteine cluster protein [Methanosalsum zhilinae]AEH60134.1 protein of unknown function UPF0153 [Methanosalsum zhilinae DSM 4017]